MSARNRKRWTGGEGFAVVDPFHHREDRDAALAEFAAAANRCIADSTAEELGSLSVAPRRHADDAFNGLHLTSKPLAAFGGACFRLGTGSSDAAVPASALVDDVADAAFLFEYSRAEVVRLAVATRGVVEAALERHPCPASPPRLTALGVTPGSTLDVFLVTVELDTLGHSLTPGVMLVRVGAAEVTSALPGMLDEALAAHSRRSDLLAGAHAGGAIGVVQTAALNIMAAARMAPYYATAMLERRKTLSFAFDHGKATGSLEWKEGVLKGAYDIVDKVEYLWNDSLTFRRQLPDTIIAALPGRQLGELMEHRFIPSDTPILDAYLHGSDQHGPGVCEPRPLRLELAMGTEPLIDPPF